jgi:hypothetical protein
MVHMDHDPPRDEDGDPDPTQMKHTCVLDCAEEGGRTLAGVAALMNVTRERVRQIVGQGCRRARHVAERIGLRLEDLVVEDRGGLHPLAQIAMAPEANGHSGLPSTRHDGVRRTREQTALVIAAAREAPGSTLDELAAATGIVRTVVNAIMHDEVVEGRCSIRRRRAPGSTRGTSWHWTMSEEGEG